jgi:hypothetical protein
MPVKMCQFLDVPLCDRRVAGLVVPNLLPRDTAEYP